MLCSARKAAASLPALRVESSPARGSFPSLFLLSITDEDVMFLVRMLEDLKCVGEGKVDMVTSWKDVALKVPISLGSQAMVLFKVLLELLSS